MNFSRLLDVAYCALSQSNDLANKEKGCRLFYLLDMLYSYIRYGIYTNQYVKSRFFELNTEARKVAADQYSELNIISSRQRDFLKRWFNERIHGQSLRHQQKRLKAYYEYYNNDGESFIDTGLFLVGGASIMREHIMYPLGKFIAGKNLQLYANVIIDYTCDVIIGDNVSLSQDVHVYTHEHDIENIMRVGDWSAPSPVLLKHGIRIGDGVWVGSKSVILSSVSSIGRGACIGSGSVCRNNIPPYAIVMGNPAKVVGFRGSVDEIQAFEENVYSVEKRLSREVLEKNYKKYFDNRINEIKTILK